MRQRKEFLGIVPGQWRHACDLRVSAREIRHNVSRFNNRYGTDPDHLDYIVSCKKGYKMTRNLDEIEEAIDRDHSIAVKRLSEIEDRRRHLDQVKKARLHGGKIE